MDKKIDIIIHENMAFTDGRMFNALILRSAIRIPLEKRG